MTPSSLTYMFPRPSLPLSCKWHPHPSPICSLVPPSPCPVKDTLIPHLYVPSSRSSTTTPMRRVCVSSRSWMLPLVRSTISPSLNHFTTGIWVPLNKPTNNYIYNVDKYKKPSSFLLWDWLPAHKRHNYGFESCYNMSSLMWYDDIWYLIDDVKKINRFTHLTLQVSSIPSPFSKSRVSLPSIFLKTYQRSFKKWLKSSLI